MSINEMTKTETRGAIAEAMAAAEAKSTPNPLAALGAPAKATTPPWEPEATDEKAAADRLAGAIDGMVHTPTNRAPVDDDRIDLPKGLRDLRDFVLPMAAVIQNWDETIQRMRTRWEDGQVVPEYRVEGEAQAIYDDALTAFEVALGRYDADWDEFQFKRAAESILRTACYDVSRAAQQVNRCISRGESLHSTVLQRGYEELRRRGLTTITEDAALESALTHGDVTAFENQALRQEEAESQHVYFSIHLRAIHDAFREKFGEPENGSAKSGRADPKMVAAQLGRLRSRRIAVPGYVAK